MLAYILTQVHPKKFEQLHIDLEYLVLFTVEDGKSDFVVLYVILKMFRVGSRVEWIVSLNLEVDVARRLLERCVEAAEMGNCYKLH